MLASAAWACADWVGWQGGPDVARTLGVVGHAALLPLVAHLVVHTWPAWRQLRLAMPWLYAVTLGIAVARLSVTDPQIDPSCWQNCTANSLLVVGQPDDRHRPAAGLARRLHPHGCRAGGGGMRARGGGPPRRAQAASADPRPRGGPRRGVRRPGRPRARRFGRDACGSALRGPPPRHGRRADRHRRRVRLGRDALAPSQATHRGAGPQPVLARDQPVASLLSKATGDPTVRVTYRVREPDGVGGRRGTPRGRTRHRPSQDVWCR